MLKLQPVGHSYWATSSGVWGSPWVWSWVWWQGSSNISCCSSCALGHQATVGSAQSGRYMAASGMQGWVSVWLDPVCGVFLGSGMKNQAGVQVDLVCRIRLVCGQIQYAAGSCVWDRPCVLTPCMGSCLGTSLTQLIQPTGLEGWDPLVYTPLQSQW